jgi:hypothetical protein
MGAERRRAKYFGNSHRGALRFVSDIFRISFAGANATVVGILLAALYQPVWTSAIESAKSLAPYPDPFRRPAGLEDSSLDPACYRPGPGWHLFVIAAANSNM